GCRTWLTFENGQFPENFARPQLSDEHVAATITGRLRNAHAADKHQVDAVIVFALANDNIIKIVDRLCGVIEQPRECSTRHGAKQRSFSGYPRKPPFTCGLIAIPANYQHLVLVSPPFGASPLRTPL